MAVVSHTLVIQCRMALGLTQQQFGEILGLNKRTVQRWEERGTTLMPSQVEVLARALGSVQPDLAVQIAAAGDTTLDKLGVQAERPVSPIGMSDPTDSVVRAAADAMGVTPDGIRPAVAAAFVRAHALGLDVQTVAEGLTRRTT